MEYLQRLYEHFTRKKTVTVVFLPPITIPREKDFEQNVHGFRNGGNSLVEFNNGMWSLLPGESLFLGSQTDLNNVRITGLRIAFRPIAGTVGGQVDLLQVLAINNNC